MGQLLQTFGLCFTPTSGHIDLEVSYLICEFLILFLDIFINYKTIIEREAIRQKSLIYWTIKLDMMRDEIAKNIT